MELSIGEIIDWCIVLCTGHVFLLSLMLLRQKCEPNKKWQRAAARHRRHRCLGALKPNKPAMKLTPCMVVPAQRDPTDPLSSGPLSRNRERLCKEEEEERQAGLLPAI